jgi:tetratricopeptide (TPR) repeat protein
VTERPADTASRLLGNAVSKFKALPTLGKAAVIAIPVLAFAALGGGGAENAAVGLSAANSSPSTAASDDSFFRTPDGILGVDLDREMERIADTYLLPGEDTGELDLEEAIEFLADKVEEDAGGRDLLEEVRDSENGQNGDNPNPIALMADAMALLSVGETWGAVANLLVAFELNEDDPAALLSLAGLANGQNLPQVALALLEGADEIEIASADMPAGISKQAAKLNNQGHALLLLGEYDDAETVLQQALALSPELSEAARNLVYVLLKQGREDEARALMPRVAFRLPGPPDLKVQVKPEKPQQPGKPPTEPPPDEVKPDVWVKQPFLLEDESGYVRLPLSISLDLSRKGQIAWPKIIIPEPGQDYPGTLDLANQRYMAAKEKREEIEAIESGLFQAAAGRRLTWSDHVQQAIEVRAAAVWQFHQVDLENQVLNADYESLIVSGDQPTRFAALDVARADHQMAEAADRLYERYRRDSECAAGDSQEACCVKQLAANDRNIQEFTPFAKEYVDRSRVLFRESYGWASAYASNLPEGHWYSIAKLQTEQGVWNTRRFTQMNVYMDFLHAAPLTAGRCYQPFEKVPDQPLALESDLPSCEAAFGKKSAKLTLGKFYSISVGCGKVKFSVKAPVSKGKLTVAGADVGGELGLQGEIEFSIKGTVTIFGGPYASASAKVGDRGLGADLKDGVYMVIGRDGIQDAGFRVSVGSSGNASGALGGSEPIMETMDFSVVSAI